MRVIRWRPDITAPFSCFRSKRVDLVNVFVFLCMMRSVPGNRRPDIVHEDHIHLACLLLPYKCDLPSLFFVYFQANTGVSHSLDYVMSLEDIYDDSGPLCPCFNL